MKLWTYGKEPHSILYTVCSETSVGCQCSICTVLDRLDLGVVEEARGPFHMVHEGRAEMPGWANLGFAQGLGLFSGYIYWAWFEIL